MLKVLSLTIGAILALAFSSTAQEWQIDAAHSSVSFKVRHMVIAWTQGSFNEFEGTIRYDTNDVKNGTAEMTVRIASINTDNEKRDEHLRSPDFFDNDKYPTMSFRSRKVVPGREGEFQLVGDLTIKDIKREVVFECRSHGSVQDFMGQTRAGFTATATINRNDFGIKWSKKLDAGGLVVGDGVSITLEIEAVKAGS
ncbi:MAG: YceI family protein [bacterium]